MFSINEPIYQRNDKQTHQGSQQHGANHGDGKWFLKFRPHVRCKKQRHHRTDGCQGRHDDWSQTSSSRRMDGFQQRSACLSQFVDGVQFQDGVIDHNPTSHNNTDGRHQVQGVSEYPKRNQSKSNVNRDFHQHNQRL